MFKFNYAEGASFLSVWLVWLCIFAILFLTNEVTRRFKVAGLLGFLVLPVVLSVLWFTVMKETTYTDWFHLAKVYSSTAGCIGFWCIRHVRGTNKKTGKEWALADNKIALCFPPLILAINILEAVIRDFEVGSKYAVMAQDLTADAPVMLMGGSWNYMNGIAGILNIIIITGWLGIKIRKKTEKDGSRDMIWPDMLWFYIIAYDLWNFAYTYNCLPHHAWYCGFALLFAQTFPLFQDYGKWRVDSTYNPTIYFVASFVALAANIAVVVYMIYKWKKTKRNPYTSELYTDLKEYQAIKALAE